MRGGDDLEAVMGVDHLDDRHRADQEEHDLRGGGDGLVELMADQRVIADRDRVDRPEQPAPSSAVALLLIPMGCSSAIAA